MLRAAFPLSRRVVLAPRGIRIGVQWPLNQVITKRNLANTKPSIQDSRAAVLPGSESKTATAPTPPPPGSVISPGTPTPPTTASDNSIPPTNVPLVPPPPPGGKVPSTTSTSALPPPLSSSPPPPPPPPPLSQPPAPKKKPRRLRNFIVSIILLSGLSFAGGVWYSLKSDNFHDFFTEYIPYGEEAVLYFEEREFHRRFPNATRTTNTHVHDTSHRINIPSKSGLSWRVARKESAGSDLETKGRHMSALTENQAKLNMENAQRNPESATAGEKKAAVESVKKDTPSNPASPPTGGSKIEAPKPEAPKAEPAKPLAAIPDQAKSEPAKPELARPTPQVLVSTKPAASDPKQATVPKTDPQTQPRMPEVDEPSVYIQITRIDPLKIPNADEPLVQDLVKIMNDIITVVNADNSTGKYTSTIAKAKTELSIVGKRIIALKEAEKSAADAKLKATQSEFDSAAKELVRRLEEEMRDQEARWRDEFESEREKITKTYEERLQSEVEKSKSLSEHRLRNQLLEQAVSLKKGFASGVKEQVDTERNGRLAKLSELSSSVTELEKLTSEWDTVISTNLQTQHLQVAVEAVRASLERADRPRPFIKELAALKEVAADDAVVNSAIGSISPVAYQRGIPTTAQLIDRFRKVAGEVRKASLLPEDAGVASFAASWALSKVMFKKQGRAIGDDVESILTRAESLLEEGNLDEAAREMNTLTGWAKTLSGDWLAEVRRVLEVKQALDVIATEARLQSLKVE